MSNIDSQEKEIAEITKQRDMLLVDKNTIKKIISNLSSEKKTLLTEILELKKTINKEKTLQEQLVESNKKLSEENLMTAEAIKSFNNKEEEFKKTVEAKTKELSLKFSENIKEANKIKKEKEDNLRLVRLLSKQNDEIKDERVKLNKDIENLNESKKRVEFDANKFAELNNEVEKNRIEQEIKSLECSDMVKELNDRLEDMKTSDAILKKTIELNEQKSEAYDEKIKKYNLLITELNEKIVKINAKEISLDKEKEAVAMMKMDLQVQKLRVDKLIRENNLRKELDKLQGTK